MTPLPSFISRPYFFKDNSLQFMVSRNFVWVAQNLCMILLSLDTHFLHHAEHVYFTRSFFFFIWVLPSLTILVCRLVSCQHISLIHAHKRIERESVIYILKNANNRTNAQTSCQNVKIQNMSLHYGACFPIFLKLLNRVTGYKNEECDGSVINPVVAHSC